MKNRRHIPVLLMLCLAGVFSCRKFIDKQKEQAAQNIITDGTWRVSRYVSGDSDLTASFSGYQFRFRDNGTVDAIAGTQVVTGTWSADLGARTIVSAFPVGHLPSSRLNYTWKVTDSYNDSVSARAEADTLLRRLELHKN